jgi:hypothetical protein
VVAPASRVILDMVLRWSVMPGRGVPRRHRTSAKGVCSMARAEILTAGALVAAVACSAGGAIGGGVFTADVSIWSPTLFGGEAFAAVINPDAVDIYPGGVEVVNTSGLLTGPVGAPSSFSYAALPVYALVDASGGAVSFADPLFGDDGLGGQDLSDPLFMLSHVGWLSMVLAHSGGGLYQVVEGFFDFSGGGVSGVGGSILFDLPPWGEPNFFWYGVGWTALQISGHEFSMVSTDEAWVGNGWPGATLDKNFFPIPAPSGAVVLGGLLLGVRRRGRPV